jgi:hypothetical protein
LTVKNIFSGVFGKQEFGMNNLIGIWFNYY